MAPTQIIKKIASSFLRIAICFLSLIGLVVCIGAFTGNETVQPFRSLQSFRPELLSSRNQILTSNTMDQYSARDHWEALHHAQALLWAINPDISSWLISLQKRNRIIWTTRSTLFNWPVIASYDWRSDDLYFGPGFWQLSEGDKAAVIAHEYFHYRQNKIWMIGDTLLETITGKLSEYGSKTEDEAYLYQLFAYRAMGMPPGETVKQYFAQRKLYRFVLSENPKAIDK